jgi:hypothetical protein
VALAAPTDHNSKSFASNHIRHKRGEDSCAVRPSPPSELDVREVENKGHCHYKVCDEIYGNRNGSTRNPDVIYRIYCEETANCTQVYLTVEVSYYKSGSRYARKNKSLPAGCVYSVTGLKNSTTVDVTTPFGVS